MKAPFNFDVHNLRMIDGFLSAVGYAALAGVSFVLLRNKEVGHRVLLWLTGIFFGVRAAANFFSIWTQIANKNPIWPFVVYFACGVASLLFAAIVIASSTDLESTLKTSERADILRVHSLENGEQLQLNLQAINRNNQERSAALVTKQQEQRIA